MTGLLDTVQAIPAAGANERLWEPALASVTALLGGAAATLEVFRPPAASPQRFYAHGLPPTDELAYLEHYAALNPRAPHTIRQPEGALVCDHQILEEAEMDRGPFYS